MALATGSPIRSLAPETLEEIVAFTTPESHLALSRVSKLLHTLCVRSIYCNVELTTLVGVVKCCRTLASNDGIASAVRSFAISYIPSSSPICSSFYSLVSKALARLTHVHHLLLLVPDCNYASVLPHCSLPRLRHFECHLPLDGTMVSFLNHHPHISYLQLGAQEEIPPPRLGDQAVTVTLPQLEYFIGNSSCVAPILHRASLRAAFITWDAVGETTGDSLAALQRSSGDTLNLLSCRRPGWNLDLLERIADHVPHIYSLVLTNLFFVDVQPTNLQAIGQHLARFSSLQRLEITCVNVRKLADEVPAPHMDSAFDTATAFGALCTSLTECTLPQAPQIRLLRVCDDLWLPDISQSVELRPSPIAILSLRWIWGVLRRSAYPGWPRVVEAVRSRGGDTWRRLEALQDAALLREYPEEDQDEVVNGVLSVKLGGVGWCV
ncbi:hypothetical protein FB45DRAFT_742174 [Roridomyces roridus]|uniref:F-box domain-containing protein n=1 Tax=Roridomyces roridus TaxID=1738132 RepID=A0AAD7FSY4_9AGAR|nr:hypothetical protein FB45DRAFT_742174 [Roridomyces roridus]